MATSGHLNLGSRAFARAVSLGSFKSKTAQSTSENHKAGDVYFECGTIDAAYFEADLRKIGKKVHAKYISLGERSMRAPSSSAPPAASPALPQAPAPAVRRAPYRTVRGPRP
jgi:hypothetical protein